MEFYSMADGVLTLLDEELDLDFKEPFSPVKVAASLEDRFPISKTHLLRVVKGLKGKVLEAYVEKGGVRDGQWISYYPSRAIKQETFYANGKLHGLSSFYAPDGKLTAQSWFVHGLREGKSISWYSDGAIYAELRFRRGVLEGNQEYFYPDGKLRTELSYVQGKLQPEPQLFAPDGSSKILP